MDLLCAFVKWHGVRLLEPELAKLKERGKRLRIVTTTYMGATEREALDRLVREFDADISIQYDALRTRLHAKAWLFHRDTGFDTAYVGSSNLSRSALLDGVEWNVRLSRIATPSLLDKFAATFDTYWNDQFFETYDPESDRDRLDDALAEASGRTTHDRVTLSLSGLEVRGYPYQLEMLETLDAERTVHDRHKNLVVAATGTGKTVVAALDYRNFCDRAVGKQPSLLFVAHRKEILEQSLRTYREVLADPNFGELYVGGARPERWRHIFASVQSLTSYGVENIPSDAYEIVVIDEFHHAQATTYRKIIDHLRPKELLGLTATPERADGIDVRQFFDGRTAVELRLWDALGADLLCPFHYFAVADGTDLRGLSWKRGRYDEGELSNLYTGDTNYLWRTSVAPDDVRLADQWSLRNTGQSVNGTTGSTDADIDAPEAWDLTTGSAEVVVAVVDSGIAYDHPDLAPNIWTNSGESGGGRETNGIDDDSNGYVDDWHGWDVVGANRASASDSDNDPRDILGHGTHVAGTIGAAGNNGIGVTGVAWNVKLMPVRVFDGEGVATSADIAEGFVYAGRMGARIANYSGGGTTFSSGSARCDRVAPRHALRRRRGQRGPRPRHAREQHVSVRADPVNIVCVGATTANDALAGFSNYSDSRSTSRRRAPTS